MDRLSEAQRHKNMSRIKSKDSKIEVTLRKALWNRGYRYRKNYKELPGKPDIVLTKYKIAVFCDSEFFHGKDYEKLVEQLKKSKNADFWMKKIAKNIERDSDVDKQLRVKGWHVVRFWGKDILKNVDDCINVIEEVIFDIKIQNAEENDYV